MVIYGPLLQWKGESYMELHIYPCLDSLLYFPVYLAIDTFRDRFSDTCLPEVGSHGERIWRFGETVKDGWKDRFRIILHRAEPSGDKMAIERLLAHEHTPQKLAIAIADPMIVLQDHIEKQESDLRVIATFINRIALWSVIRFPTRNKREIKTAIVNIVREASERGRPNRKDFLSLESKNVAYCEKGFTTKYLLKYFVGLDHNEYNHVRDFGEGEISPLLKNESYISFTNVPWLAEALSGEQLKTERLFPPVPFPFSSIITTHQSIKHDKLARVSSTALISEFVRNLYLSMALTYRFERSVTDHLSVVKGDFRDYGLSPEYYSDQVGKVITKAVREMVKSDCLSEGLDNAWIYWDFAFEVWALGHNRKEESWAICYKKAWLNGTHDYIRDVLNDEFLKYSLRKSMASFIERTEKRDPVPPLFWKE